MNFHSNLGQVINLGIKLPSLCLAVKSSPKLMAPPFTYTDESRTKGRVPEKHVCMYTHDLSTYMSINICSASNSEVCSSMYEYCKYSAKYKKPTTQRRPMILLSRTTKIPDREGYVLGAMEKGAEKSLLNRQRFSFAD